jgi:hypothetical protein
MPDSLYHHFFLEPHQSLHRRYESRAREVRGGIRYQWNA